MSTTSARPSLLARGLEPDATAADVEQHPQADGFAHIPALDGLRAVAVLAVVAFHADFGWAKGGFLGVDVFFVLSGFLITSLLRGEHARRGAVSLGRFWARRARRLLPALGFLFVTLIVYAALRPAQPSLTSLRGDMLAGIGYVANWRFVLTGNGYFAAFAPSPLRHLWSLAIEEQFYLVWPLAFLLIVRARRPAVVALVLAVASATLMFAQYHTGDPSRVYYGTDTHAHGLLLGAALAFVTIPRSRWLPPLAFVAALGALACFASFEGGAASVYRGGLLGFELLVVVVVAACAQPGGGVVKAALSWTPLRAIGLVSYGLYLWHWPVFVLCDEQLVGLSGYPLRAVQLLVTAAFTVFSYFVIELPFRRGLLPGRHALAFVPVVVGAIVAALVLVTASLESPITYAADSTRGQSAFKPTHPGRRRVMVVGDSTGVTLAGGLARDAKAIGVEVVNGARLGCPLDWRADEVRHGDTWMPMFQGRKCDWSRFWPGLLSRYRPDLVLIMFGPDDIGDRREGHHIYQYNTRAWRARMARRTAQAVATLRRGGARVGILLNPALTIRPSARPLNDLFSSVARRQAVPVFDLGPVVNRGGTTYRFDGIHYTPAGAEAAGSAITGWINTLGPP